MHQKHAVNFLGSFITFSNTSSPLSLSCLPTRPPLQLQKRTFASEMYLVGGRGLSAPLSPTVKKKLFAHRASIPSPLLSPNAPPTMTRHKFRSLYPCGQAQAQGCTSVAVVERGGGGRRPSFFFLFWQGRGRRRRKLEGLSSRPRSHPTIKQGFPPLILDRTFPPLVDKEAFFRVCIHPPFLFAWP